MLNRNSALVPDSGVFRKHLTFAITNVLTFYAIMTSNKKVFVATPHLTSSALFVKISHQEERTQPAEECKVRPQLLGPNAWQWQQTYGIDRFGLSYHIGSPTCRSTIFHNQFQVWPEDLEHPNQEARADLTAGHPFCS